jgi:hypothetical protein
VARPPGPNATPTPTPQEVEVPNVTRRGAAGGSAAARPGHPARRPTTADLVGEAIVALLGPARVVLRHPALLLALIVTAAVVENSYLHP